MLDETHSVRLVLEPLDDHVVLEPTDEESETRAGLIIPASAGVRCASGIVAAIGPGVEGVAPGDKVLFPKDAGFDVRLGGIGQKVVRRRELIARVHD